MNVPVLKMSHNEYISIRYLNFFRIFLSFFFFSIIFKEVGGYVGFAYKLDIAKLLAVIYLSFSIFVWVLSIFFKESSNKIVLIALMIDLPFIISLTLLFDGLNNGWVILPVITIGSFSILSRSPYTIFFMPVMATVFLWKLPKIIGIDHPGMNFSSTLLYAITYFSIALVGIRQSKNYSESILLTEKQKQKITNLSKINELIIEQMQSGVIAFNNSFHIVSINKHAQDILNTNIGEILPEHVIKFIKTNPKSTSHNFNLYGEDVLINIVDLDQQSDVCLIFIDSQALINEKSQQINLANLGQLSATIAHELRNPMAAIYSASQLLNESEHLKKDDLELTDIITGQIERSNKIIEDILLMSKPHIADQITINIFKKLNKFKQDFCQQNDRDLDLIQFNIPDKSLTIKFDNSHLSQLFWNLTENAFRHGLEKNLQVSVSNQSQFVLIDFKNTGEIFPTNVEENLFTPFFTTHNQGTGLGLYICREMCKSNHAKLEYLRQDFQHVFRIHIQK